MATALEFRVPVFFAGTLVLLSACASTNHPLMPTPLLYQAEPGSSALFAQTSPQRQSTALELIYFTNRLPSVEKDASLPYGGERSPSMAFGSAVIEMLPDLTWEELQEQSRLPRRSKPVNLELTDVTEKGRFPEHPYGLEVVDSRLVRSPAVMAQHVEARSEFQALLSDQLGHSASNKVVLYVHGFNETFATAAYTLADLCHFLGREPVCVFFSWPASKDGSLLFSYASTTESATFAVAHLVKAVRTIAQTPGVKGIDLVAHSRGSALILNAMRELGIEAVAAGLDPATALKADNVVLLAPDIDKDIALQQIEVLASNPDMFSHWPHERLPRFVNGRLTVYASPQDKALSLSRFLFRSRNRLGRLVPDKTTLATQGRLKPRGNIDLIVYQGRRTDRFGHFYFFTNPRVSSDLIQLLRYGTAPGKPGRPLLKIGPAAWTFPKSQT